MQLDIDSEPYVARIVLRVRSMHSGKKKLKGSGEYQSVATENNVWRMILMLVKLWVTSIIRSIFVTYRQTESDTYELSMHIVQVS